MNNLSQYISEKLHINKDTKINASINDYKINDICLIISYYPEKNAIKLHLGEVVYKLDNIIKLHLKFSRYNEYVLTLKYNNDKQYLSGESENKRVEYLIITKEDNFKILKEIEDNNYLFDFNNDSKLIEVHNRFGKKIDDDDIYKLKENIKHNKIYNE